MNRNGYEEGDGAPASTDGERFLTFERTDRLDHLAGLHRADLATGARGRAAPPASRSDVAGLRDVLRTTFARCDVRSVIDYNLGGEPTKLDAVRALSSSLGTRRHRVLDLAEPRDDHPAAADAVTCINVLERVDVLDLGHVLADAMSRARRVLVVMIECGPSGNLLPDGSDVHATQRAEDWWRGVLEIMAAARPDLEIHFHVSGSVQPRSAPLVLNANERCRLLTGLPADGGHDRRAISFDADVPAARVSFPDTPRAHQLLDNYRRIARNGYRTVFGERVSGYGHQEARFFKDNLRDLFTRLGAGTVLDYGGGTTPWDRVKVKDDAGARRSLSDHVGVSEYRSHDPGAGTHDPRPGDVVTCIDVLEHVDVIDMGNVLADIIRRARFAVFLNVACFRSAAILPDGENAHATVRRPNWWRGAVELLASANPGTEIHLYCSTAHKKTLPPIVFDFALRRARLTNMAPTGSPATSRESGTGIARHHTPAPDSTGAEFAGTDKTGEEDSAP